MCVLWLILSVLICWAPYVLSLICLSFKILICIVCIGYWSALIVKKLFWIVNHDRFVDIFGITWIFVAIKIKTQFFKCFDYVFIISWTCVWVARKPIEFCVDFFGVLFCFLFKRNYRLDCAVEFVFAIWHRICVFAKVVGQIFHCIYLRFWQFYIFFKAIFEFSCFK